MITSNDSLNKLHELDENYFISLQFRILQKNIVRCHLFYGTNTNCRMRFYPEHLTTIIPKFFLKNCDVNYYQNMQKLFDAKYKHGFATDLNDAVFNKYYKIITKAEHVSVNYNRNVIKQNITLGYEYKDVLYHKITQLNRQCKPGKELEIEECPFIAHIVESLVLFCKIEYNVPSNADKFDIHYLSKCYNHIINTHLFCLRKDQRKLIQKYICSQVSCPLGRNCMVLKNHSLREREVFISKQQQSVSDRSVILMDILRTCLNSLHCYLLHEGGKLYRLEKDTNCAGRFATDSNPLQFTDEIDSLTQFLIEITCTRHMRSISFFMQWLLQEEYDWSSILLDINCRDPDQSNIYLILKQYGISHLFHIIHNKYINSVSSEDKHLKDNVDAINFGISVIHWLEYGDLPNHKSFITEILHNKYSTVNQQLLEKYKNECLIKIETSETLYRYTLNEMLSLKLYTDTTKFTSLFRKAHWTNQNMMQMKKEFYWWAITLYKTSKYHARPLPPFDSKNPKPSKLFHGINTILAVNERLPKYHGPVSTTLVDTVAHQFSDGSGLLWSISTTYYNPFRFIKGISVSWISCHKNESEMLLMDEYLHITTTLNFANNQKKIQHLCSKLMIYKEKIIDKNMFWQQMGFKLNNELLTVIQTHPLLLQITQYQDNTETQTVLQRLVGELSVVALKPLLHAFKNIVLKNIFIRNDTIVCIPSKVLFGELILITDHKEIANPIDKIEQHELNSDVAVYGSFVEYDGPLQIIVPYNTNIVSVGLYLRSSIQLSFILIKTFKINHQIQEDTLYNRISYLFGALKIYEKPLKYGDNFCKAVDIKYIETHKDQSINVIKNHPMLLEYSNFQQRTMLPILLKILNFQTLKNEFSDRLCLSLIYRKLQIKDPNAFWKSQGCQKQDIQDEYILSNIKKHPLLLKPTQYLQRTLLQRLVEELEIDEMRETYDFFESITDTRNVNVNLYIKDDKIICMEIHKIYKSNIKYIVVTHTENDNITYQIDSKHTENVYIYQNIDIRAEFVVPFAVDLHSVSVYAQISAEFNYILLKTFDIKQKIKQDTPSNRVDYLLNVLSLVHYKIDNKDIFYDKIGLKYSDDWIPLILHHPLLFQKVEIIHVFDKLVKELQISELSDPFIACTSPLKVVSQHHNFNYHIYTIQIPENNPNNIEQILSTTEYKLCDSTDDGKQEHFEFKWNGNFSISTNKSYHLFLKNQPLFGNKYVLIRRFKLTDCKECQTLLPIVTSFSINGNVITTKCGQHLQGNFILLSNNNPKLQIQLDEFKENIYIYEHNNYQNYHNFDENWSCNSCTYSNKSTNSECEICTTLNPYILLNVQYDNVSDLEFIIPYAANAKIASLYVQPSPECDYTLIKSFTIKNPIKIDGINARINYILNILVSYKQRINKEIFYQQIGIYFEEEWIDIIKQHLFISITSKLERLEKIQILKRLVFELEIDVFKPVLKLYSTQLQCLPLNLMNRCLFRVNDEVKYADFSYTTYKDGTDGNIPSKIRLSDDEELIICKDDKILCQILVENEKLFGFKHDLLLQQISTADECFKQCTTSFMEELHIDIKPFVIGEQIKCRNKMHNKLSDASVVKIYDNEDKICVKWNFLNKMDIKKEHFSLFIDPNILQSKQIISIKNIDLVSAKDEISNYGLKV
eukprot:425850_1